MFLLSSWIDYLTMCLNYSQMKMCQCYPTTLNPIRRPRWASPPEGFPSMHNKFLQQSSKRSSRKAIRLMVCDMKAPSLPAPSFCLFIMSLFLSRCLLTPCWSCGRPRSTGCGPAPGCPPGRLYHMWWWSPSCPLRLAVGSPWSRLWSGSLHHLRIEKKTHP